MSETVTTEAGERLPVLYIVPGPGEHRFGPWTTVLVLGPQPSLLRRIVRRIVVEAQYLASWFSDDDRKARALNRETRRIAAQQERDRYFERPGGLAGE
jgi:hypothetical protein